jgi:hypothetical protein
MIKRSFLVVACALLAASVASSQLTVIKLKSGETVEGFVVEQTAAFVKLETIEGKAFRYNAQDIASQEETTRTGYPELDKKLEGIDRSNADALADVTEWAKTQKMRAWTALAREVLKADPQHEKGNTLLGHTKVGERWFKSKTEAENARKAEIDAEMKQKGMIKVAGGWISKEDKPLYDKDKNAFILDDKTGVWRDKATVMKERGLTLVKGKWVRGASPEDQAEMDAFKKAHGEDINILQFEHFRLAMMNTPTEKIEEYGKLCEDVYAWFLKEMGKPADYELWPRKGYIWAFKDKKIRDEWLKQNRARLGIAEKGLDYALTTGQFYSGVALWSLVILEGAEDIRNLLIHNVGHFTISHFARGLQGTPNWLGEGWSHYCEHAKLGAGHVACSSKANYGGQGGIADKGKFSTKDAKDRCRGLIREGSAEPMTNLSKLDLNSLNGDHLAKGWSVVEWLMSTRKQQFIDWLEGMNKEGQEEALGTAIPGWNFAKLDEEWEAYVKAKY